MSRGGLFSQLSHGPRGPWKEYAAGSRVPTNYRLSDYSEIDWQLRCRSPGCSLAIDLVEHAAIAEVFLLRLGPAAEILDGHEFELREQLGMFRGHCGIARTVVVASGDLLAF